MTDSTLREQITKCFGDTKMPEDDQFEPDVELFDIESTIDRIEALTALKVQEARIEEIVFLERLELEFDANVSQYAGERWDDSDAALMLQHRLKQLKDSGGRA